MKERERRERERDVGRERKGRATGERGNRSIERESE